MKTTLVRLSALLLTFSVGISLSHFFKRQHSTESSLAGPSSGAASVVSFRCPGSEKQILKDGYLVISVPSDTEIYLGQRKVALDEIPGGVRRVLSNQPVDAQVVVIKSAASVRFETVSLIADQVRSANVKCIEFVLDKKKRVPPLQTPITRVIACTLDRRGAFHSETIDR